MLQSICGTDRSISKPHVAIRRRNAITPPDILAQHAHADRPIANSRWDAVDLACKANAPDPADEDDEEIIVRAKLVRSDDGAAMCVAEAIGHAVLETIGLQVADAFCVQVSADFALVLQEQYEFDVVHEGRHWGTRALLTDAVDAELDTSIVEDLARPEQLFTLYLGDVILANPDRDTAGNVLLTSNVSGGGLGLVPIDQSECFNHPRTIRDNDSLRRCRNETIAGDPPGMEPVLFDSGREMIEAELEAVTDRRDEIVECSREPHGEWYDRSGVSRDAVREFLDYRVANLETLAQMDHWRGISELDGGNHVLL